MSTLLKGLAGPIFAKIGPLSSANFDEFNEAFRMNAQLEGRLVYLDETVAKPEDVTSVNYKNWDQGRGKVKMLFASYLGDHARGLIVPNEEPKDSWDRIVAHFKKQPRLAGMALLKRFTNLDLETTPGGYDAFSTKFLFLRRGINLALKSQLAVESARLTALGIENPAINDITVKLRQTCDEERARITPAQALVVSRNRELAEAQALAAAAPTLPHHHNNANVNRGRGRGGGGGGRGGGANRGGRGNLTENISNANAWPWGRNSRGQFQLGRDMCSKCFVDGHWAEAGAGHTGCTLNARQQAQSKCAELAKFRISVNKNQVIGLVAYMIGDKSPYFPADSAAVENAFRTQELAHNAYRAHLNGARPQEHGYATCATYPPPGISILDGHNRFDGIGDMEEMDALGAFTQRALRVTVALDGRVTEDEEESGSDDELPALVPGDAVREETGFESAYIDAPAVYPGSPNYEQRPGRDYTFSAHYGLAPKRMVLSLEEYDEMMEIKLLMEQGVWEDIDTNEGAIIDQPTYVLVRRPHLGQPCPTPTASCDECNRRVREVANGSNNNDTAFAQTTLIVDESAALAADSPAALEYEEIFGPQTPPRDYVWEARMLEDVHHARRCQAEQDAEECAMLNRAYSLSKEGYVAISHEKYAELLEAQRRDQAATAAAAAATVTAAADARRSNYEYAFPSFTTTRELRDHYFESAGANMVGFNAFITSPISAKIILDSGASCTMTDILEFLENYRELPLERQIKISGAGGGSCYATGVGTMHHITSLPDGTMAELVIENVLYTPGLGHTLISTTALMRDGYTFTNTTSTLDIINPRGKLVGLGHIGRQAITLIVRPSSLPPLSPLLWPTR
ncbi:hypothetical protein P7C70_g7758, partial [Phenoliferia sp. Uapishka_3]